LVPYVTVNRFTQNFTNSEPLSATEYGIAAVLRVRNPTNRRLYVSQLVVTGDITVDFATYDSTFGKEGEPIGSTRNEYLTRKPFRRLSWVSYPKDHALVDANGDEVFIRFVFLKPQELFRAEAGSGTQSDSSRYFGYHAENIVPDILTTLPNVFDIFTFERFQPELQFQHIRSEFAEGSARFQALIESKAYPLSKSAVRGAQWSMIDNWEKSTPEDLFFKSDRLRPVSKDPAIGK